MGIAIKDLPTFDAADFLEDEQDIRAFLETVLEDGSPEEVVEALGIVARARGMQEIAQRSGVTREALYKALRPGAKPRFETILRVLQALDLRLSVVPAHKQAPTT